MFTKKAVTALSAALLLTTISFQPSFAYSNGAVLKQGMSNSDVTELQRDLKTLGFFNYNTTGYFGSITESSVINFQKRYGISPDGIAGPITCSKIKKLISQTSSVSRGGTVHTGTTAASGTTLKSGMRNASVSELQRNLKTLGFMSVDPTGYFGSITSSAVIKFQRYFGLTPDGIAGPLTFAKIKNVLDMVKDVSGGNINSKAPISSTSFSKQWIPGLPKTPYRNGVGMYEGVVFHYTNNVNDTAQIEADYEKKNWNEAFVHEFIDSKQIIQVANPDYSAWGAGTYGNSRFIHIELCHANNQKDFDTSYNMITERIAEYLYANKLGVSPAKADGTGTLWSHNDVSNYLGGTDHTDPIAYLAKWGKSWKDVIDTVTQDYNALAEKDETNP